MTVVQMAGLRVVLRVEWMDGSKAAMMAEQMAERRVYSMVD